MPNPNINLLNVSAEEFEEQFMSVLFQLMRNNDNKPKMNYYLIRCPETSNLHSIPNLNIADLNMKCSSIYEYWWYLNMYSERIKLMYNYQDIITQVRDYLDYPEIRTATHEYIKYSYREIIDLVMAEFKFNVIQIPPQDANVSMNNLDDY